MTVDLHPSFVVNHSFVNRMFISHGSTASSWEGVRRGGGIICLVHGVEASKRDASLFCRVPQISRVSAQSTIDDQESMRERVRQRGRD